MKKTLALIFIVSTLTSCVSNKAVTKTTPVVKTNKLMVLPYEDYIFNGIKMMNAGDTLFLDPANASKN